VKIGLCTDHAKVYASYKPQLLTSPNRRRPKYHPRPRPGNSISTSSRALPGRYHAGEARSAHLRPHGTQKPPRCLVQSGERHCGWWRVASVGGCRLRSVLAERATAKSDRQRFRSVAKAKRISPGFTTLSTPRPGTFQTFLSPLSRAPTTRRTVLVSAEPTRRPAGQSPSRWRK